MPFCWTPPAPVRAMCARSSGHLWPALTGSFQLMFGARVAEFHPAENGPPGGTRSEGARGPPPRRSFLPRAQEPARRALRPRRGFGTPPVWRLLKEFCCKPKEIQPKEMQLDWVRCFTRPNKRLACALFVQLEQLAVQPCAVKCLCSVSFTWGWKSLLGYGAKLHHQGTASFHPCFHLPGFRFGNLFLTRSHFWPDHVRCKGCKGCAIKDASDLSSGYSSVTRSQHLPLDRSGCRPGPKLIPGPSRGQNY